MLCRIAPKKIAMVSEHLDRFGQARAIKLRRCISTAQDVGKSIDSYGLQMACSTEMMHDDTSEGILALDACNKARARDRKHGGRHE